MPTLPMKTLLDEAGLNRQHVFDLQQLPPALRAPLSVQAHERQLILFAHAGRRLWERVQAEPVPLPHPIDTYSLRTVEQWLAQALPRARYRFVYPRGLPAGQHVGLQRLGTLAGWHHASPFMVGVDARWGSWFAYRVAVLTDTALPASPTEDHGHPCEGCSAKPCISACPAHALDAGTMDVDACQQYRLQENSSCALACLARQACPVGAEHRYEDSQIRHSAAGSLQVIRRLTGK
jgi:NAD-dependent dihydropyrimidine dehydrogenase PreA subunit